MALTEICFPSKFFNITEGSLGFSVTKGGKVIDSAKYQLSPSYYTTMKSFVFLIVCKGVRWLGFRNQHKMESKLIDFSVGTISQRIFIETMPGLKMFLDSGDLQQVFGFMPSNETLEIDNNLSTSPIVHDNQRFPARIVYTDFINNTFLGDVKAPVLKSFLIDYSHFETTQGLISQSFHNPEFRRLLNHSFHSISIDLRSHSGELIPFFSLGYTHLSLLFRRMQN